MSDPDPLYARIVKNHALSCQPPSCCLSQCSSVLRLSVRREPEPSPVPEARQEVMQFEPVTRGRFEKERADDRGRPGSRRAHVFAQERAGEVKEKYKCRIPNGHK